MVAPDCGHSSDWVYLHAVCHPGAGTWLRLGPNGAHVLECKECRKMITAFRVLSGEAENITHEPGLTYEEAVEPYLDEVTVLKISCHNCEAVFSFSPSEQMAVEAGWLQAEPGSTIWACPSCRSAALLVAMEDIVARRVERENQGGICGAMRDRNGETIVDDLEDWKDAATICREPAGHLGGCHYEQV